MRTIGLALHHMTEYAQLKLRNIYVKLPNFENCAYCKKYIQMIRNTIIIASIWSKNMLRYLSLDIVCSSKLAVFLKLHSWKIVCFSEQTMSAKNYLGIICWCQIICNLCYVLFRYTFLQVQVQKFQ